MIVEQRTYTLHPGALPSFLDAYQRSAWPIHREVYQRLVGFYTTETGVLNQVVQLWAFDSLQDRAERRAQVQRDPRWSEYMAQVEGMLVQQETRLLSPTAWSPSPQPQP